MKTSDLLLDFIEGLGYSASLIEIPITSAARKRDPMRQVLNSDTMDMIVLSVCRDGSIPVMLCSGFPSGVNWCNAMMFRHDNRPACTITIDVLGHVTDSYSSQTLYLDDPTLFSKLTAFLDHWYFRIFQRD